MPVGIIVLFSFQWYNPVEDQTKWSDRKYFSPFNNTWCNFHVLRVNQFKGFALGFYNVSRQIFYIRQTKCVLRYIHVCHQSNTNQYNLLQEKKVMTNLEFFEKENCKQADTTSSL